MTKEIVMSNLHQLYDRLSHRLQDKQQIFVLALIFGMIWFACTSEHQKKISGQEKDTEKLKRGEGFRSMAELLWVFDEEEAEKETAVHIRKVLSETKVRTPIEARGFATGYKSQNRVILANERAEVLGLIRLGRNVKDVGEKGDYIWIVHYQFGATSVTEEFWINSATGKVHSVLPGE